MTTIFNKFKSLIATIMVLSLFMGITFSSCTPDKKSGNSEKVEASESEEHPSGGEHPEGEEHPSGDEEHPSDSTKQEHPST